MSKTLTDPELQTALGSLHGWAKNGIAIERKYEFKDFLEAMKFVNKVADAAEAAGHHPDIQIVYSRVTLQLTSHDSGGVTHRDIKMAGRLNEIHP
ncbi:pterin-4-alpha-carbinolamine dehydratase [Candidatus Koribacter versatilis Ellin345]|uniref:Putative pterin-4-alpha-carbinolamine dehydratase n=1 Tax=Koribacter versatilis (strain Ellin345) TaxID=204669 RepID=PHS_KORVE|nr:4a-hydroxytetrahydrobiopterin dehydratase [Candidatus Koribacter versatilis]Q1IP68.1 RecName: Full=Putative pterin-4-alpha-carbinolamine dehydratase; Short=PHS; AltName: Full=4-alpha-hydroxy-tetrahydropterin dehydratase; AltName: Full=Pterin carbinolamine dehydratase; Short=PCD [Candidatus Koribacter versatilis Ellin345]ABF41332.1 pterin-4-alpha-carbinolamine dehydratase [Candidatus Koribacter versatilis Ellin345]